MNPADRWRVSDGHPHPPPADFDDADRRVVRDRSEHGGGAGRASTHVRPLLRPSVARADRTCRGCSDLWGRRVGGGRCRSSDRRRRRPLRSSHDIPHGGHDAGHREPAPSVHPRECRRRGRPIRWYSIRRQRLAVRPDPVLVEDGVGAIARTRFVGDGLHSSAGLPGFPPHVPQLLTGPQRLPCITRVPLGLNVDDDPDDEGKKKRDDGHDGHPQHPMTRRSRHDDAATGGFPPWIVPCSSYTEWRTPGISGDPDARPAGH